MIVCSFLLFLANKFMRGLLLGQMVKALRILIKSNKISSRKIVPIYS